jgi:hypothetical protein
VVLSLLAGIPRVQTRRTQCRVGFVHAGVPHQSHHPADVLRRHWHWLSDDLHGPLCQRQPDCAEGCCNCSILVYLHGLHPPYATSTDKDPKLGTIANVWASGPDNAVTSSPPRRTALISFEVELPKDAGADSTGLQGADPGRRRGVLQPPAGNQVLANFLACENESYVICCQKYLLISDNGRFREFPATVGRGFGRRPAGKLW